MSLAVVSMAISLAAATAGQPQAEQSEFVQLFATTCMANAFSSEKLRETLSSPLTPELPPERAAAFLRGHPGRAWQAFSREGQYAVSLTESGICAVFARKAPIDEVREGFVMLVSSAPEPLVAHQVSGAQAGPNTDDLSSTAYVWSQPGERLSIVFTLTTSKTARDPEIQAMASVALAQSEP